MRNVLQYAGFGLLMIGAILYLSNEKQHRDRYNEHQIELFEHAIAALEMNAVRLEQGEDHLRIASALIAAAARLRDQQTNHSGE